MRRSLDDLAPWPVELIVDRATGQLDISFDDGKCFKLPAVLLRAMTPSAAERGHGAPHDEPLSGDFSTVGLVEAQVVGAYAVRIVFDDGHDSGIYTWAMLYRLGEEKKRLLEALNQGLRLQP